MGALLSLAGIACIIGGIVCYIMILIEAFRDEVWKGVVSLLCGLYGLYYSIFEFEHDNKWLIVCGALFGSSVGLFLIKSAATVALH